MVVSYSKFKYIESFKQSNMEPLQTYFISLPHGVHRQGWLCDLREPQFKLVDQRGIWEHLISSITVIDAILYA